MTSVRTFSRLGSMTRLRPVRMGVTGACNTIVDLGLLNLLLLAGLGSNDAGRLLASGIAYCIASLNAYYWHDRWVFASNLGPRPRPVLWFGGVGLVALTANTFGVLALARLLNQSAMEPLAALNVAKFLVLGLTALFSYASYARLVFRTDELHDPRRSGSAKAASDQQGGAV